MKTIVLEGKKRSEKGKVAAKNLRKQGLVPAVIFGKKTESIPLMIQDQKLEKALHQGAAHRIVNLKIEADGTKAEDPVREEKLCMIQEVQRDVFGKQLLHVDFHEISMEEKISSKIPLELEGNAPGVKEGGILDHVLWEVEVEALPLNLPEKLTLDVSGLAINQSLHVKDIKAPEGVELLSQPHEVVVVVHPPRVEEAPAAAVAVEGAAAIPAAAPATPAQPEVISKGKKEEEEVEEKPKK